MVIECNIAAETIIMNITGADAVETKEYVAEFRLSWRFRNSMNKKGQRFVRTAVFPGIMESVIFLA